MIKEEISKLFKRFRGKAYHPELHIAPYNGCNNKKKTKGRLKNENVQSIPIFNTDKKGIIKYMGYKYIYH